MQQSLKQLDELGLVSRGKSKHRPRDAAHLYDGPYPFIQTGDVKSANFYITKYSQTYSEAGLKQSKLWKKGTLCITIAANIAETAILGIDACFPDSIIGFIADPNKACVKYIKYLMDTLKQRYQSVSQGAAQSNLSQKKLLSIKFPVPPLEKQIEISHILSSYDDLIENNHRRMQLLEQAARLIYEEWFIRFRFPGHEQMQIIDGLPEGWKKKQLGEIITLKYGKALKAEDRFDGKIPVYGSSGIVGYHNQAIVKGPSIIVGRKGNVGSIYWSQSDFYPIDTVYYIDASHANRFLYYSLKNLVFHSSDSAVPGLNRDYAHRQPLIYPQESIIHHFEEMTKILFEQILHLENYNQKLTQARDLLLPKLMNGEIQV